MNNISDSTKKCKQKLKVTDYIFEIDGKEISKVEVEYNFINLTSTSFKDGKKDKIKFIPAISIDISGIDNNNNEAWFCFELDMSLEQLNKYTNQPTDITQYVADCEAFIKKPYMDHSRELDLYFPTNTLEDIYHDLTSVWVVKKDTNIFIFKVCVPSDNVFTFFEVNFNDEKGE